MKGVLSRAAVTTLLAAAGLMLSAGSAHAGPCDGFDKEFKKAMAQIKKICGGKCEKLKGGKAAKAAKKATAMWKKIAGNSWAKLGPRTYKFGAANKGTIMAPGQRMWHSTLPASGAVKVTVAKRSGKSRVVVHICLADSKGKAKKVGGFDVPKGGGKFSKTANVGGATGKLVYVKLVGKTVGRKMGYTLTVK